MEEIGISLMKIMIQQKQIYEIAATVIQCAKWIFSTNIDVMFFPHSTLDSLGVWNTLLNVV